MHKANILSVFSVSHNINFKRTSSVLLQRGFCLKTIYYANNTNMHSISTTKNYVEKDLLTLLLMGCFLPLTLMEGGSICPHPKFYLWKPEITGLFLWWKQNSVLILKFWRYGHFPDSELSSDRGRGGGWELNMPILARLTAN